MARWDPTNGAGTPEPPLVQAGRRLPYCREDYELTHAFIGLGQSSTRELDPRPNRGPRMFVFSWRPMPGIYNPYPQAIQQEVYRQFGGTIEILNRRRGGL